MKAMEWRSVMYVIVAILAWACSGEDGDPVGTGGSAGTSQTGGTAGTGGISGSGGTSATGGMSGSSGSTGGISGQSGSGGGPAGSGGSGGDTDAGDASPDGSDADAQAGSGGTGGSPDASTGSTGGTPSGGGTGGKPDSGTGSTGGTGNSGGNGSGGSGTGATGGTPDSGTGSTGGTGGSPDAGTGSTGGTGGTSATGGTGGTSATGGTGGSGGDAGAPKPLNCGSWTRTLLPGNLDLTGKGWAAADNDVYVPAGKYSTGEIAHFDGSSWSLMTLPAVSGSWANMKVVSGSSASDVYAGGSYLPTMGMGRSRLLRRVNKGAWAIDSTFPWTSGEHTVRSIWGASPDDIFVMVDYAVNGKGDIKIYRKNGSSWNAMTLPAHGPDIMMWQLWGKAGNEVYAVGTELDATSNPVKPLLWYYDGNGSWKDLSSTLPSDVDALGGVNGAGGELWVVGHTTGGKGVRLMTKDRLSWTKYVSSGTTYEGDLIVLWEGAVLATASSAPPTSGSARITRLSLGSWFEMTVDNLLVTLTGIWTSAGSSKVWVAGYGNNGWDASVLTADCQ